jgi:hypothetical protein
MTTIQKAIPSLTDLRRLNSGKIRYEIGKGWTGRKVVIEVGEGKRVICTFNAFLKHLDHLAQKEKGDNKKDLIKAVLKEVIELKGQGRISLVVEKKKMNVCEKILLVLRRFFGNLGKSTHLQQIGNFTKYLAPEPLKDISQEIYMEIAPLFKTPICKKLASIKKLPDLKDANNPLKKLYDELIQDKEVHEQLCKISSQHDRKEMLQILLTIGQQNFPLAYMLCRDPKAVPTACRDDTIDELVIAFLHDPLIRNALKEKIEEKSQQKLKGLI